MPKKTINPVMKLRDIVVALCTAEHRRRLLLASAKIKIVAIKRDSKPSVVIPLCSLPFRHLARRTRRMAAVVQKYSVKGRTRLVLPPISLFSFSQFSGLRDQMPGDTDTTAY